MILLQIQKENIFLTPSKRQNFVSFLVFVGAAASFAARISSFETVAKKRSRCESHPKTAKSQELSELREPIRTRENRYPLIW